MEQHITLVELSIGRVNNTNIEISSNYDNMLLLLSAIDGDKKQIVIKNLKNALSELENTLTDLEGM